MALTVFVSNRLEFLATLLAEHLKEAPPSLTPEIVVVPSRGMERYLAMTLAQELGVCAAVAFPFPGAVVEDLALRLQVPGAQTPLSRTLLLWRLLAALHASEAILPPELRAPAPRQRMRHATALAAVFERYLLFRPHWLLRWQEGRRCGELPPEYHALEDWQRHLWTQAIRGQEDNHRAAITTALITALQGDTLPGLPHRLALFGLSNLPPLFLQLLVAVARHIPVQVYLLSPSPQNWERHPALESASAARLLALLGRTTRDCLDALEPHGTILPLFAEPTPDTMLGLLQADLLHLPDAPPAVDIPRCRCHLEVHACPTPRREVEVLRERLLALLQADPSLAPHHILVVVTDMATYAPLLHAVLGAGAPPQLPYSVSDDNDATQSPEMELLLNLLTAAAGRLERSRVFELLTAPPTRTLLGGSDADEERLRLWFEEAGIAWGIDREFRQSLGLPPSDTGTWRAGLTRLALGLATGPTEELVLGMAPLALPSNEEERQLLARCIAWLDALQRLTALVHEAKPAWDEILPWMLTTFFPQEGAGLVPLRRAVAETITAWKEAGQPPACAHTMALAITHSLGLASAETGFLAHGITCCSPRPMRAVPFRVVAILGLGAGAFPRAEITPRFDLAAAIPRPGDRSLWDDDRATFLHLILSARDHLLLFLPEASTPGPSPLLEALLEHLDCRATVDGIPPSQALITHHPPFPFHPQALDIHFPCPTHTPARLAEAQALLAPKRPSPSLFPRPLPEPTLPTELDLDDLIAALAHPCRALLRSLGIIPPQPEEAVSDDEPLTTPQRLAAYRIKERLLPQALAGATHQELLRLCQAWHWLPDSPAAEAVAAPLLSAVTTVANEVRAMAPSGLLVRPCSVLLDGVVLYGSLHHEGNTIFLPRPSKLRPRDAVALRLTALMAGASGQATNAALITEEGTFTASCPPSAAAMAQLLQFLDLWRELHRRPLPFFPKSCLAYAQSLPKGEQSACEAMQKAWKSGPFPECQDPFLARCFPDGPPWEAAKDLARHLLAPVFAGGPGG